MGGPTSRASRKLSDIRKQLKSGRTRGRKPRLLEDDELMALKDSEASLMASMKQQRHAKRLAKLMRHTSDEADRCIRLIPDAFQQHLDLELDKRLGPAPSSAMEEALAERTRADKRIRELRRAAGESDHVGA